MYADEAMGWFDDDGVARETGGTGRMSFSYRPELAKVIAVTLTEDGHEGQVYDITTPPPVSLEELAQVASEVTGRPHRYEPLREDEWLDRWTAAGRTGWHLESGTSAYAALRDGEFDVPSDDYRRVTGLDPLTIGEVIARQTAV
jgi:NAD(P)H dehydrogenase (quinone)